MSETKNVCVGCGKEFSNSDVWCGFCGIPVKEIEVKNNHE